MQHYLQNNVTNLTPVGNQLPSFSSNVPNGAPGPVYPALNQQARKGVAGKNKQLISADYQMNMGGVAHSQNTTQLSGLIKNFNATNSSRNFVNQTEQLGQPGSIGRNSGGPMHSNGNPQQQKRNKISKPPKYDGSSSRYGNMYADSQLDQRGIPKPHHIEELQLRSTHYGGAVDKLLTTQKIGQGFKGLPNQLGQVNTQATPQAYRPAPINFNRNTFQDMYNQQPSDSVKATTRVPNISNKPRHQKLQNHLYNATGGASANRDNSQVNQSRDSPVVTKKTNIPKLQNLNTNAGSGGGSNILPKMETNMRSTHLKLDPIDASSFVS